MTKPGDADSYVAIDSPLLNNGRPVLRFVRTTARDVVTSVEPSAADIAKAHAALARQGEL
ncbi:MULTISPECIES: hypothetical protein [Amycolatopsis]|uniref:Uncharacterized protein n=1 Tax=Amycolatopsis tucumanensis TaxID=401106 RepID=A0ABP7HXR0_9PSEU|nr:MULTISPECIES: hypothetical protein [Amycolatopsis]MCF6422081.1 hypothetical protein [Amycolatopsis tucumanensis]